MSKLNTELAMKLAMKLYDKYCEAVGGKAFNGDALPTSGEFFSDESKQKQANAWIVVATEAMLELIPPIKETTFKERLVIEKSLLDDNIKKLSAFLNTDNFSKLPMIQQVLLDAQCLVMQSYSQILFDRIKNL